jgi:hypothetical protein
MDADREFVATLCGMLPPIPGGSRAAPERSATDAAVALHSGGTFEVSLTARYLPHESCL